MVQYSFTSTETRRLVRTDSPGRPPRLSHSSCTMTNTGPWTYILYHAPGSTRRCPERGVAAENGEKQRGLKTAGGVILCRSPWTAVPVSCNRQVLVAVPSCQRGFCLRWTLVEQCLLSSLPCSSARLKAVFASVFRDVCGCVYEGGVLVKQCLSFSLPFRKYIDSNRNT